MLRSLVLLALLSAACLPSIPKRGVDPPASHPEKLPTVAPGARVHTNVEEDLSNAAHGVDGVWRSMYSTFVLRRPEGVVLIDAATGPHLEEDLDEAPFWFRWTLGGARGARPLSALLAEIGVRPEEVTHVLLTHAHWDHTGGLEELPNAKVVMAEAEADWILNAEGHLDHAGMPHHLDSVRDRVRPISFEGPAYDGFSGSRDVFGDGSVVAVPTPGHTPGATSWFINSGDGRRWLFVGDAAWVKEGYETPVMKGRLASTMADRDKETTAASLGHLHAIHQAKRATVVTSHDDRTWVDVPRCAAQ